MQARYPSVKLRKVLIWNRKIAELAPDVVYKQITVRLHHKGVTIREEKTGRELRTKQFFVRKGQFIISRIDARNGAMGLIPEELDHAVVTNDFLVYDINESRLLPEYFNHVTSSRSFVDECAKASEGTTNRVRVKPEKFLEIQRELPPIGEQKRIISKIESLMVKIEEAKKLRVEAEEEVEKLSSAMYSEVFSDRSVMSITKKVDQICTKPQYGYTDSAKYEPVGPKFLRITDIQNGKVEWDKVPYSSCPTKEKYLLHPGDVLFARSGATTGKSFLVRSSPQSIFASYLIRIKVKEGVLPEYLYEFFQSPAYWSQVIEETKGSALPNMNGKKLANIDVPLPESEGTQRQIIDRITRFKKKIDELKGLQTETEEEIDRLIPSILENALKGDL